MQRIREANHTDLDAIYLMGQDVWAEGQSTAEYLAGCRSSPKYAKGKWYVLEADDGEIVSSLITYHIEPRVFGIGSIATAPQARKRGFASKLIESVIEKLESNEKTLTWYLYADIEPGFYERFGFQALPAQFQRYLPSVCMIRSSEAKELLTASGFTAPKYF